MDIAQNKCIIIYCSFKIYGGVLDSTDVGFLRCKSKMYWASLKGTKRSHGAKNRVRALGFKNRLAAKRRGFKSRRFALAA